MNDRKNPPWRHTTGFAVISAIQVYIPGTISFNDLCTCTLRNESSTEIGESNTLLL